MKKLTLILTLLSFTLIASSQAAYPDGCYMNFEDLIPIDPAMQSKKLKEDIYFSTQFGAVAGAFAGAELALMRFLYIIDTKTNEVKMVDPAVMNDVLQYNPDLYLKYNTESLKDDRDTQIEFLKLVNKSSQ